MFQTSCMYWITIKTVPKFRGLLKLPIQPFPLCQFITFTDEKTILEPINEGHNSSNTNIKIFTHWCRCSHCHPRVLQTNVRGVHRRHQNAFPRACSSTVRIFLPSFIRRHPLHKLCFLWVSYLILHWQSVPSQCSTLDRIVVNKNRTSSWLNVPFTSQGNLINLRQTFGFMIPSRIRKFHLISSVLYTQSNRKL